MKLLIISLRTTGLLKEMFEEYCHEWTKLSDVYCITNDNVQDESLGTANVLHLHYRRKEPWSYLSLSKVIKAKRFIDQVKPDLILFFSPHPNNIPLIKYASYYPLAVQIHNPVPHSGTKITERIVSEIQKKLYFKYCDKIFVSGKRLKQELIETYNVDSDKIFSRKFAALSNLINNDLIDTDEKYDIIFFGRIEYYKGIDILLDALKYTSKKYSCLIVGKGKPYFEVGKDTNVTFINEFVPDDKLAEMIQQSKVVVMPYRDATGTSTVIQAFSFKKPVISSDAGVFPEYVSDGGLVVEKNNPIELAKAIDELVDDPMRRKKMGEIGYSYLKDEFEISHFCKDYLNEFKKIVNTRN